VFAAIAVTALASFFILAKRKPSTGLLVEIGIRTLMRLMG